MTTQHQAMWAVTPSNDAHHNLTLESDPRMSANTTAYAIIMALEVLGIHTRLKETTTNDGRPGWGVYQGRHEDKPIIIITYTPIEVAAQS
jgi:hypothetical protein